MLQMRKRRSYQTILQDQTKRDHSRNLRHVGKRRSLETGEELRLENLITLSVTIRNEEEQTVTRKRLIDTRTRTTIISKT